MNSLWSSAGAAVEKAKAEATRLAVNAEAIATSAAEQARVEASRLAANVESVATSASKSVSHNVGNLMRDGYGVKAAECDLCGATSEKDASSVAYNISTGKIHSFQRCIVCNRRCCPKCISWSRYLIPESMHYQNIKIRDPTKSVNSSNICRYNTVTGAPKPTHSAEARASLAVSPEPEKDWLCVECEVDTVLPLWNVDFEASKGSAFHGHITAFIESELENQDHLPLVHINYVFFPKPQREGGTEAERKRHERMRQVQVVDVTLRTLCLTPVTGMFGFMLGAFQGSMAVLGIIDSEVAEFLTRVYEVLDSMGLTDAPAQHVVADVPVEAGAGGDEDVEASKLGGVEIETKETAESAAAGPGPTKKSLKDSAVEVLRLYYYGCDVLRRQKSEREFHMKGHAAGDEGILLPTCPPELFGYVGRYVAPAQWLYNSLLPVPHDGSEWSGWYLSQILRHQQSGGWTLLMCSNETSVLPSGVLCPGFALAVRNYTDGSSSGSGSRGEVLLTIRGSTTSKDWFINVNEKPVPFEYLQGGFESWAGSSGEANAAGADTDLPSIASKTEPYARAPFKRVACHVHGGMLSAALGLLEQYHVAEYLTQLREMGGYTDVKVVGHSLGAGVATLIVALLKNSLVAGWEKMKVAASGVSNTPPSLSSMQQTRPVCGIGFAPPACVCSALADALLTDNIFTSVVNKDDIVPRLNRNNMRELAAALSRSDQVDRANRWGAVDYRDAKNWVTSIGKAKMIRDRSDSGSDSPARPYGEQQHPPAVEDLLPVSATAPVQPTTDFTTSAGAGAGSVSGADVGDVSGLRSCSPDRPALSFVVPGKVIHLVETEGGTTVAVLGTHRMQCLQMIYPILESVHQHTMRVYTNAMRCAKLTTTPPEAIPPVGVTASTPMAADSTDESLLLPYRGERQLLQTDVMRKSVVGGSSVSAAAGYNVCGVCKVDGAWPLVLQSNATRAMTMKNCAVCGLLVCVFCAPTGGTIQGDGYKATIQLPDYRTVVPRLNHLEPQITCRCCFINSYNL